MNRQNLYCQGRTCLNTVGNNYQKYVQKIIKNNMSELLAFRGQTDAQN